MLRAVKKQQQEAASGYMKAETTLVQLAKKQEELGPRLMFRSDLPKEVMLSIMGKLSRWRRCAASVCRSWCSSIEKASEMGMFRSTVLCVRAGHSNSNQRGHSVVCTTGGINIFGCGAGCRLGHDEFVWGNEEVPRRLDSLGPMQVVMASAGDGHTVVCTRQWRVFTFGVGHDGQLGHGDLQRDEDDHVDGGIVCSVPRLVDGLVGTRVVYVAASGDHTAVCTDAGQLYTFGFGYLGQLGHGENVQIEWMPRLVQALVGTKTVGVEAGDGHTVVLTEAGGVLTFGDGHLGQLGHGTVATEYMPRVVKTLGES